MGHPPSRAHDGLSITFPVDVHVTVPGAPPVPLPGELRYDRADPYAVCLSLGRPTPFSVDWFFARSLLAEGLRRPAGIGDIVVIPQRHRHPDALRILLRPRAGVALLDVKASAVGAFLRQTEVMVPPGTEHRHLDMDDVVARLTAGGE